MQTETWTPQLNGRWKDIPLETYQFILERGKEKFEEIITDGETMTDRALKLFYALVIFLSAIIGVAIKEPGKMEIFIFLMFVLYGIDLLLLILLIRPRRTSGRGTQPKDFLGEHMVPSDYTPEDIRYISYYHEIIRIQSGIDKNKSMNATRHRLYNSAFYLSAFIFIITAMIILSIIFRP